MDLMQHDILNGSEATSVSSAKKKSKSNLRCLSLILLFPLLFLVPLLGRSGAESASPAAHEYRLRFYHTHTGERLEVVYRRGDQYPRSAGPARPLSARPPYRRCSSF